MQEDELTNEMVATLQALENHQISGEMDEVPATTALEELKQRMAAVNLATFCPIFEKGANNSEITLELTNASVLIGATAIAICSANQLRLRENGQFVILPVIGEFSPAGRLQPQPGGNLVVAGKADGTFMAQNNT